MAGDPRRDAGRRRRRARRQPAHRPAPRGAPGRARRPRRRLGPRRGDRRADRARRPRGAARARPRSSPTRSPAASCPASTEADAADAAGMFVLAMGKMGARRAQLLLRHRPDRALRRDPPRPRRLRRAPPRLHPRHPAAGEAALRGHRRRLRLPHRPAAAPRPLGDAGLHRHRAGRALLREPRPHLGARRLHQGPRLRRRGRRRRGVPRPAAALRLAPAPRLRGDPGRPRHAAAHPRAQGPRRPARRSPATTSSSARAASARSSSSPRPAS